MCEPNIIAGNAIEFENVIYEESIGNRIVVKEIVRKLREFKNHKIAEVDMERKR